MEEKTRVVLPAAALSLTLLVLLALSAFQALGASGASASGVPALLASPWAVLAAVTAACFVALRLSRARTR
jgi:hypothetical protein